MTKARRDGWGGGALIALGLGAWLVGCQVDDATGLGLGEPPPAVARPPDAGRPPPAPQPTAAADAGVAVAPPPGAVADAALPAADGPPPVDGQAPGPGDAAAEVAADAGSVGITSVGGCSDSPDLALCLRFEGNVLDQSANHLVVRNAPTRYEPAPGGQAIDVRPGVRMAIDETPVLDSVLLTIETTVKPRALARRMTILENTGQYGLYVLPSGSVMCTGAGTYALINDGVAPGRWTRLTCVFDGAYVSLHIDDGRSRVVPAETPLATDRTRGLLIGWEDLPDRELDGLIDELRIWRIARRP